MKPWRVNLHYPWWMRRPPPRPGPRLAMLRTLEAALLARDDVSLSGSAAACRTRGFPGEAVWTLNFHSVWKGPRNLHYKEAYLPGFYSFDPAGYSGWSANAGLRFDPAAISADEAGRYFDGLAQRFLIPRVSKYAQPAQRTEIPAGCIFVALQVPRDKVLTLADLDTHAMLAGCLARAPREPVVIKLHPRSRDPQFEAQVRGLHDPAGHVHVLDEPIDALIAAARVTVCINSGVGIEAQLRGGAVITCGASDYGALTRRARSAAELETALDSAAPPDPDLMRRHATWLFRDVFVDDTAPGWTDKVLDRLAAT